MTTKFLKAVQVRTARVSCSPSATRGQGKNVAKAGRKYLAKLRLSQFAIASADEFRRRLDEETFALSNSFPRKSRSWGLARKLLNIFLRDAFYTTYLEEKFNLKRAEFNFEIPLDSITAKHLRKEAGRRNLPGWNGVKHLSDEGSAEYQRFAEVFAAERGIARVHLDTYWWGREDE